MEEKKETKKANNFYQKWWFWICIVLVAIIISFTAIMMVGYNMAAGGIGKVAMTIQSIDSEATVYSSAGGNTVIVEIPNYTDATKEDKKASIIKNIQTFASNNGELSNYSKFILITKMNSDNKQDYFYFTDVYSLPDMTKDTTTSKSYIDFIELTKETVGTTENAKTSNVDNTSNISGNNANTQQNTTTNTKTNNAKQTTSTQNATTNKTEENKNTQSQPQTSQTTTTTTSTSKPSSSTNTTTTSSTKGQTNALNQAKNYLSFTAFSYSGLIEQLKFEGYSDNDAKYGADNCGANWNEQAAKKAKSYLDIMSFSKDGLIEQLKFDGFTSSQAEYGAKSVGY